MFFEVYKKGNLIKRGKETLGAISFENELMTVPSCSLVLPVDWLQYFDGREEVKIHINGKVFWGIVWDIEVDKSEETISLTLRHVISEWEYRQISVNHAMSNQELNIVYKGDAVVKNEGNDEAITADDFTVIAKNIASMTTAQWIEKAHVQAWVISNGDKVDVPNVDTSKVKKENGDYDVTFSTAKGTSITVKCSVKEDVTYQNQKKKTNKTNREVVAATPFSISIDEAQNKTREQIIAMTKPEAWVYRHKNQKVAITGKTSNYVPQVGEYDVTVSTARGSSITVKVKVEETGSYGNISDPAIIDKLEDIYNDENFAYPGWYIDLQDGSASTMIDYVYSKQNKLDALTQTMELTQDLFWRVGWWNEKKVEIGKFGRQKPWIVSLKPSGRTNIRILEEPVVDYDFDRVINVATVYSDKSDSGMASLTLREVYNDQNKQDPNFPVVILRADANNERGYDMYNAPDQPFKVAPNNELEFAVLDTESIALEQGTVIEGSFSFNDLNPFEIDSKTVTDEKRMQAAETVYHAAIRKLIQARRSYSVEITTEEIPADLLPGDKVRLIYDNRIWNLEACSSYWKKILSYDDWFYLTRIEHDIDANEVEINKLTLTKWLRIDRETSNNGTTY